MCAKKCISVSTGQECTKRGQLGRVGLVKTGGVGSGCHLYQKESMSLKIYVMAALDSMQDQVSGFIHKNVQKVDDSLAR